MTSASSLPTFCPVLVVGAGPTGLLSANLLGTYGVETLLIEQNETTCDLPKAILIDDEGLRALQAVGLTDDVIPRLISGYGARYYSPEGECFATVEAPVTRQGYPPRNSFLQPELERIMAAGIGRFASVRAEFGTKLLSISNQGDGVAVQLELADGRRHEMTCRFLLACDGAKSTVREQLGIAMSGITDPRDWVVIDTVSDPDRDRFSKFFCDPARPMVSIPAPAGGRRYEFMILPGEDPRVMSGRETIRSVLSRFRMVPDADVLRAVVYTFHTRVAERLTSGRIALLGDAAHLSPPFAGQGMNAGLRDAFNVAWKVKLALAGTVSADILETYETERRGPTVEMIEYAVALGEIVMPPAGLDDAARQAIRAHLLAEPQADGAAPMRPKPESVYENGWREPASSSQQSALTGRAFPEFEVTLESGENRLLDDILGSEFALVALGAEAGRLLAETDVSRSPLALRKVGIELDNAGAKREQLATVRPAGPDFGLSDHAGSIFLVRPDRFVAAEWKRNKASIPDQISQLCRSWANTN